MAIHTLFSTNLNWVLTRKTGGGSTRPKSTPVRGAPEQNDTHFPDSSFTQSKSFKLLETLLFPQPGKMNCLWERVKAKPPAWAPAWAGGAGSPFPHYKVSFLIPVEGKRKETPPWDSGLQALSTSAAELGKMRKTAPIMGLSVIKPQQFAAGKMGKAWRDPPSLRFKHTGLAESGTQKCWEKHSSIPGFPWIKR